MARMLGMLQFTYCIDGQRRIWRILPSASKAHIRSLIRQLGISLWNKGQWWCYLIKFTWERVRESYHRKCSSVIGVSGRYESFIFIVSIWPHRNLQCNSKCSQFMQQIRNQTCKILYSMWCERPQKQSKRQLQVKIFK